MKRHLQTPCILPASFQQFRFVASLWNPGLDDWSESQCRRLQDSPGHFPGRCHTRSQQGLMSKETTTDGGPYPGEIIRTEVSCRLARRWNVHTDPRYMLPFWPLQFNSFVFIASLWIPGLGNWSESRCRRLEATPGHFLVRCHTRSQQGLIVEGDNHGWGSIPRTNNPD